MKRSHQIEGLPSLLFLPAVLQRKNCIMQVAYSNVLDKRAIALVCEALIASILKDNSSPDGSRRRRQANSLDLCNTIPMVPYEEAWDRLKGPCRYNVRHSRTGSQSQGLVPTSFIICLPLTTKENKECFCK